MTYITDIQELRKAERKENKDLRKDWAEMLIKRQTDAFLAGGGKVTEIPPGICSETIIIPVKQPDGQYKNDHHARGNSRHRQQEKIKQLKSGDSSC